MLSTFERYTDAAKRVIYFARLEANHRNADAITPEHILAGLTWESDSTLVGIAPLKEVTLSLRSKTDLPHLPSTSFPYLRDRNIPLNDGAKITLAYAVQEADRDWQYWLDCNHLLRGLMRFPNPANDALQQEGYKLNSVRSAVRVQRRTTLPKPAPKWGYLKLALHRGRHLWRRLVFLLAILAIALLVKIRGSV